MVREGGEEPGEEAEEDGAAGRAGEGDHHAEYQHQVHHHPQVPGWGCRGPAGCGDLQGPSGTPELRHGRDRACFVSRPCRAPCGVAPLCLLLT